ncbi:MAG: hypothetical protein QM704_02400 [Anaeromyxobacteraceae bacterium]
MFVELETVRRIEAAEASLTLEVARAVNAPGGLVRAFGPGAGAWSHAGSPFDKVIGWGFGDDAGDDAALRAFEADVAARGGAVRVELSTVHALRHAEALTARGYRVHGLENVLGLRVGPGHAAAAPAQGVEVRPASPGPEEEAWLEAVTTGFGEADPTDPAPHEAFDAELLKGVFRQMGAASGLRRYLARVDGAVAGGATMRVSGGVAQLAGAATLAAFRRRGVQAALLRARLADAAREGCDVAVVTTEPGSRSQRNVQRTGFALLYGRLVLVR